MFNQQYHALGGNTIRQFITPSNIALAVTVLFVLVAAAFSFAFGFWGRSIAVQTTIDNHALANKTTAVAILAACNIPQSGKIAELEVSTTTANYSVFLETENPQTPLGCSGVFMVDLEALVNGTVTLTTSAYQKVFYYLALEWRGSSNTTIPTKLINVKNSFTSISMKITRDVDLKGNLANVHYELTTLSTSVDGLIKITLTAEKDGYKREQKATFTLPQFATTCVSLIGVMQIPGFLFPAVPPATTFEKVGRWTIVFIGSILYVLALSLDHRFIQHVYVNLW